MTDACEHEWVKGRLTSGMPTWECAKCPRWRLRFSPSPQTRRDPESTRRSMEETSRHLGEHRDV